MPAGSIPVSDLLYLFFFIVPGFLTFKLTTFIGKVPVKFDQFDKTAISVTISGLTLLIPYFLYLQPNTAQLEAASLGQLGITFVIDVVIAVVLGIMIGAVYDRCVRAETVYRPELWLNTIQEMDQGVQTTVTTMSGTTIRGPLAQYERLDDSPALLLEDAEIISSQHGDLDQGKVYIRGEDISQVWFRKVPDESKFE